MLEYYHIRFRERPQKQQLLAALCTLSAAILTFIFPNFLYLIAGGYLILLGVLFLIGKFPAPVITLPLVAGIIIFLFPEIIPFTFAGFLLIFGALLFLLFKPLGILTLIIAVIILINPESIALFIALFMLIYAISDIVNYAKARRIRE